MLLDLISLELPNKALHESELYCGAFSFQLHHKSTELRQIAITFNSTLFPPPPNLNKTHPKQQDKATASHRALEHLSLLLTWATGNKKYLSLKAQNQLSPKRQGLGNSLITCEIQKGTPTPRAAALENSVQDRLMMCHHLGTVPQDLLH